MDEKRILIVANQTAGGHHVIEAARRRMVAGPCRFTVLVPATPPREHAVWTDEEALTLADRRLKEAVDELRELGADVKGVVGDPSPIEAIGDELRTSFYEEIILSTLPSGASRWLKQDLPHKVERRFGLKVTHIISQPATV